MIKSMITGCILALALVSSPSIATDKQVEETISVNINSADAEELDKQLAGIGVKKAQAIIEFRTKHGKFKTIEDLAGVKGIGEKIIAENKEKIKL